MDINYDEKLVPKYTLPDPLLYDSGIRVHDADDWRANRRREILDLFSTQMYGKTPEKNLPVRYEIIEVSDQALGGRAIRKQIRMVFVGNGKSLAIELLLYLPKNFNRPAPLFLGLNFRGNHTIHSDPQIQLPSSWVRSGDGVVNNKATDAGRGVMSSRWPVELIIERGYGLATIHYGDIDPDYNDGFQNGVHPLFFEAGQVSPSEDEWGSIGAWAWGLSRALDYFETDSDIDHERVAVFGHSRLGKTALWAGAQDERFAFVISNNSGCGGAALSRRWFGETLKSINTSCPHWFCGNFKQYNEREADLPIDQHMLIALIAPRPVYVASATEDLWADPRGEFLAAKKASAVYALFGKDGLADQEMPKPGQPLHRTVGYHLREGKHDVTIYDWEQWLAFVDQFL